MAVTDLVVIVIVYRVERRSQLIGSHIYSYESESESYNYKSSVSKNHQNSILIVNYDS